VLNTAGGPQVGATVNFTLNTTVGGITLTPASATTDASGEVQTVVSGGTVATTVSVTATTTTTGSGTISTQSNALTVSTGIPTSANISLAVACPNIQAWNIDGQEMGVTVSMTDRFSNPVPPGTTANFQTTLGGVQASCQTGAGTTGAGLCTVNWTSKAPYQVNGNPQATQGNTIDTAYAHMNAAYCATTLGGPFNPANNLGTCNGTTNGRSPIIATAIGEESFKDANGVGYFNPGDTVAWDPQDADNDFTSGSSAGQPKTWMDTFEPFLNEWELYDSYDTPQYVLGEPFLDFFNKGTWQGPDGLMESALCTGPLCSTTSSTVAIFSSNVIIVSGEHANLLITKQSSAPDVNSDYHYDSGGATSVTLYFEIFDDRMQQMPAGTGVTIAGSGGFNYTVTTSFGTGTYNWPCTSAPPYMQTAVSNNVSNPPTLIAGQPFGVTVTPATGASQFGGPLVITVTTPPLTQNGNQLGAAVTTFSIGMEP
jgi:hypothetical protein